MYNLTGLDDLKPAEKVVRNRLLLSVDGLTGVGKTHFALTAPDPIVVFDLDVRTEGVIHKFADKKIVVAKYRLPILDDQPIDIAATQQLWANFKKVFKKALVSGARTIIIDTGTEAWELIRLARFGKLTQVQPYHYGPVNAEFRGLLRTALECEADVNVILVHKKKSKYVNDKRTDDFERAGFSDMDFMVQVAVDIEYGEMEDGEIGSICTITKCGLDVSMLGFTLEGDMCTFPCLAQILIPGGNW